MKLKAGINYGVPFLDYLHNPYGINNTGLKQIIKSERHFENYLSTPHSVSRELLIGTAAHCKRLEPLEFDSRVFVFDGVRRGKKWDEFHAGMPADGVCLSPAEYGIVMAIDEAIENHELASPIFNGDGKTEVTVCWTDEDTGIRCQGRIDKVLPDLQVIADLKTTRDASPEYFPRQSWNYGYAMQAAYYLDGINAAQDTDEYHGFLFAAVENTPPHNVAVFMPDLQFIEYGRAQYKKALRLYKRYLENKKTNRPAQGYAAVWHTLSLPPWVKE